MDAEQPNSPAGQPHLVSLVLQSKKALQHGEALCSKASALSSASAQTAVDVMSLDAKVQWIKNAVVEQLKMAAQVAKIIQTKRTQLEMVAQGWDTLRTQRTDALDTILETLGSQVVPPDFHTTPSSDVSPFGLPQDSDEENDSGGPSADPRPGTSPTDTLRNVSRYTKPRVNGVQKDRSSWKTLRDFVDERAIEDMLDRVDSDRNALDTLFARTSDQPEYLMASIGAIEDDMPAQTSLPLFDNIFTAQEDAKGNMAAHLESLAGHYDQMTAILHDHEAGEQFSEEDIQEMNRDTEELPAILSELEQNVKAIEDTHEQLLTAKRAAEQHTETLRRTLDDLDELGGIMTDMLEQQEAVENESTEHLNLLHDHLVTIEDLHHRYTSYEYAYNMLLLELARRRRYREDAERLVKSMISQLDTMAEEELQLREEFKAAHGQYLPDDVCLYVQNAPTRWTVVPQDEEQVEVLAELESDLLERARSRIRRAEGGGLQVNGSQSL
ncbi:autophagy protein Apg17-domain-containing protein [Rhodofomes roseus]|uniref:Autophagy-related protein 17 n=1 Tax=Rhodofomes roseus TaxID=34475 RepID=A0ABQ8KJY8_9APHY|nr:autophagy protein Apg17-domain-containing protein [Rhodofomes roseus]KAH9838401.1 autophagy protein Apg17-domain-containing protein [Rhodofomes roseus]